MVKVKFKGLHLGSQLGIFFYYFLDHLEPSKEAGGSLLFSKSFFQDFYMNFFFLNVFWGSLLSVIEKLLNKNQLFLKSLSRAFVPAPAILEKKWAACSGSPAL